MGWGGKRDADLAAPGGKDAAASSPKAQQLEAPVPQREEQRLKIVPGLECHCSGWMSAARSCWDETFLSPKEPDKITVYGQAFPCDGLLPPW